MPVLSTVGGASLRAFGAFLPVGSTATFIAASGGTETTSGNYKYHTFTSSDNFVVTAAPSGRYIDILLVGAGGTSGGSSTGGGGGVKIREGESIGLGTYGITVGQPVNGAGSNGGNTIAIGLTALGGGGGGIDGFPDNYVAGKSGGSGGGSAAISQGPAGNPYASAAGAGLQPTSASGGFGNAGGQGTLIPIGNPVTGYTMSGGAGGGAGGAASAYTAGPGKSGSPLSSALYGGGGSSSFTPSANTGWGGTDATNNDATAGIVIIRYLYQ